jgi:hypothetical protein
MTFEDSVALEGFLPRTGGKFRVLEIAEETNKDSVALSRPDCPLSPTARFHLAFTGL